jgi:hypothetical protein
MKVIKKNNNSQKNNLFRYLEKKDRRGWGKDISWARKKKDFRKGPNT